MLSRGAEPPGPPRFVVGAGDSVRFGSWSALVIRFGSQLALVTRFWCLRLASGVLVHDVGAGVRKTK